jgi:hypothetical protein
MGVSVKTDAPVRDNCDMLVAASRTITSIIPTSDLTIIMRPRHIRASSSGDHGGQRGQESEFASHLFLSKGRLFVSAPCTYFVT